jgi:excisionase family DNA binding protein
MRVQTPHDRIDSSTKDQKQMQSGTESGLITVQDAAKFLAVSTSTLYGWVYQRRIPFVKVGRALRFELAELQKFIQANRFQVRA